MINPLLIINQLFEMQAKMKDKGIVNDFDRNLKRLYTIFEDEGYIVQDPTGENYSETRTDYEASISGHIGLKMKISRTIKPIIYQQKDGCALLLQKGVVLVEN